MTQYNANITFRNGKYPPVEVRGYFRSDTIADKMIKFSLPEGEAVLYHLDDIHEIETQKYEE